MWQWSRKAKLTLLKETGLSGYLFLLEETFQYFTPHRLPHTLTKPASSLAPKHRSQQRQVSPVMMTEG